MSTIQNLITEIEDLKSKILQEKTNRKAKIDEEIQISQKIKDINEENDEINNILHESAVKLEENEVELERLEEKLKKVRQLRDSADCKELQLEALLKQNQVKLAEELDMLEQATDLEALLKHNQNTLADAHDMTEEATNSGQSEYSATGLISGETSTLRQELPRKGVNKRQPVKPLDHQQSQASTVQRSKSKKTESVQGGQSSHSKPAIKEDSIE